MKIKYISKRLTLNPDKYWYSSHTKVNYLIPNPMWLRSYERFDTYTFHTSFDINNKRTSTAKVKRQYYNYIKLNRKVSEDILQLKRIGMLEWG